MPHRHNPNGNWAKKRSLYNMAREEVTHAYESAFFDRDKGEVVATRENVLLDLEQGEILRDGLRYVRSFDILNRRR